MSLKITIFASLILLSGIIHAGNKPTRNIGGKGDSIEFIPNKGQLTDMKGKVRKDLLYLALDGPVTFYLRNSGLSYVINTKRNPKLAPGYKDDDDDDNYAPDEPKKELIDILEHKTDIKKDTFRTCRVDMDFVGASQPVTQNISPTQGYLNYYLQQCPNGITKVKAYENVIYKGIYPNIDVSYKGTYSNGLKYDIIVNPGGNSNLIKMRYTGAEKVEVANGKLQLIAFTGKMEEKIPKIYQKINGLEISIEGNYVMYHQGKDSLDGTIVGIKIKNYNPAYPLVIDPWWVTYSSGSNGDIGYSIALDNASNTLLTGEATSTDFPVSVGAFQSSLAGAGNVFIIKFGPTGNRLWATYYGGSGSDVAYGIASDINNNVLVTGITSSTNFPVSVGAFQTAIGGPQNAFVLKFDPSGNRLWGTFCGGSGTDYGFAITTDYSGNVAITGSTASANFPVSPGAYQTILGGTRGNAFVMKFSPAGNRLWGTYFGGSATITGGFGVTGDIGYGISADAKGNFAFAGCDCSNDFPVSPGCFQSTQGFSFIAELNPNGNRLWATYFGAPGAGTGYPRGINGCAVDKNNNVIIGGMDGGGRGIVTTPGVYQTTYTTGNGFAAKFNPVGNLIWTTWVNIGHDECGVMCLAVDEGNNVYTVQEPDPGNSFPSPSCAFQSVPPPTEELYVIKLDSNAHYACSTYIGGANYDTRSLYPGTGLAVRNGRMACAPYTGGSIPVTPGAFQAVDPSANFTAAIFNLCSFGCGDTTPPALGVSGFSANSNTCNGYVTFSANAHSKCDSLGGIFQWEFPGGSPSSATGSTISNVLFTNPGTYTVTCKYIACAIDSIEQTVVITSGFHDSLALVNPANCHQNGKATAYPTKGVAPYTFKWSNGTTSQSDTGLAPGTYTCVVTGKNGCTDTTIFTILPAVSPAIVTKPRSDTGYCVGGKVTLSASKGSNFNWSPATGLSCTLCANPTASPTVTTVYTLSGLDSVGCPDTVKITVNVDSLPKFTITQHITSCGGATFLEGVPSTSSSNWSWTWSPPIGLTQPTLRETDASPLVTTTYTLTASNGYCSSSDTVTVHPEPPPFTMTITASPDTICLGGLVSLSLNSSEILTTIFWTPTNGLSCSTCTNPTLNTSLIVPTYPTYDLEVEGIDSAGCSVIDTIKLHIFPSIKIVRDTFICKGSQITLTAPFTVSSYLWSTGATTSSITVAPNASTSYTVVGSNGCIDSATTIVTVYTPALNACCDTTIPPGDSVVIYGSGAPNYLWSPRNSLSCDTCASPVATPSVTTTYTVVSTDAHGCTIQKVVTVIVELPCADFTVPNVFTPNNDGVNDDFVINILNPSSYKIDIYDRWGKEVYTSTDPTAYWNGKILNTDYLVPDGVYYYILKATCETNNYLKKGFVEVIGEQ